MHDPWLIVQPKMPRVHIRNIEKATVLKLIAAKRATHQLELASRKETTC